MGYNRFYLGFDNGTSGSMAIIGQGLGLPTEILAFKTPSVVQLNYTKTKSNITRVDGNRLRKILSETIPEGSEVRVIIERPFVQPKLFNISMLAARAFEATLIVLESLGYGYEVIDSKEWQKDLLPKGVKGADLKTASLDVANRLYPGKNPVGHPDGDGILIAHYCMKKYK